MMGVIENPIGRPRLLALAVAGAVGGHALAYALSIPNQVVRRSVLAETGHAYWHAAVAAAGIAAVWFTFSHVAHHVMAARRRELIGHGFTAVFVTLAMLQVAVFGGMEALERISAGVPVASILNHRVLLIGVSTQIVVAALLAIAAYVLGRAGALLGAALSTLPSMRPGRAVWIPSPAMRRPVALGLAACGSRGPPFS